MYSLPISFYFECVCPAIHQDLHFLTKVILLGSHSNNRSNNNNSNNTYFKVKILFKLNLLFLDATEKCFGKKHNQFIFKNPFTLSFISSIWLCVNSVAQLCQTEFRIKNSKH